MNKWHNTTILSIAYTSTLVKSFLPRLKMVRLLNMIIKVIKNKIEYILKRNGVKRAAIFGSYARGQENKNSDIDILIEYENDDEKSFFDVIGLKLELEKELKRKVDLVEYSMIHPRLKKQILKEQLVVI